MTTPVEIPVYEMPDAKGVAVAGAGWLAERLVDCVQEAGETVLAISGGRSPWPMFRRLVSAGGVPWSHIHIVQVDERVAPAGHPDRNWSNVDEVFGQIVPSKNLHPMPVEESDLESASETYAQLLLNLTAGRGIGVCHLGLGEDGHTASLFPGDPALEATDRAVVCTSEIHGGYRRMTLTLPVISSAQHVMWQVQGHTKKDMLSRMRRGDQDLPAGRVRRQHAVIFADQEALGS